MARHAREPRQRWQALGTRAGAWHYRIYCRRYRRSAAGSKGEKWQADSCHRRAAHGWHECSRRFVWPRQDVSAASGQICPRHEVRRRASHSVYRAGKGRRRSQDGHSRQAEGQNCHRHGEGRRARHRQKYRFGGAAMQQFRGG